LRGPVVIGGDNLPSPVRIGLTDLPNIGGASGPPGPPGSGTTELNILMLIVSHISMGAGKNVLNPEKILQESIKLTKSLPI